MLLSVTVGAYVADRPASLVAFDALSSRPSPSDLPLLVAGSPAAATSSPAPFRRAAWLHVRKCGSSFGTALFHWTDGANASPTLPVNASLPDCDHNKICRGHGGDEVSVFVKEYGPVAQWAPDGLWPGPNKGHRMKANEYINSSSWEEWKGDFVGFFRDPVARGYSSYNYFVRGHGSRGFTHFNATELQHAHCIEGSVVKMVAGQEESNRDEMLGPSDCDRATKDGPTIVPDVSTAIARLQGFKFVGVTSDWERSICLFHAKLGGPCYAVEFEDSRPTSGN